MKKDNDMSNTFVSDVGQKSAIFKEDEIEELEMEEESKFPEVEIEPPKEMPTTLEDKKEELPKEEIKETVKEEEEFLEAKKKKKEKKYKKRNPFCMFLLILVCLALGAGASYYYFEVYNVDNTNKTDKKEVSSKKEKSSTEELKPESVFVKQLIEKYDDINSYSIKNYEVLYSKDKTLAKELDIDFVHSLAITNLRNDFFFSKEELQDSMNQLFGDSVYTVKEETIILNNKCIEYQYDKGYYSLEKSSACGGTAIYDTQRKIVKAEKAKDSLTVNVAVAITDGSKLYKGYDVNTGAGTDEIEEIAYSGFDMDKDYDKFNQYQYQFKYDDKIDNYYLESIKLIEK